MIQANALDLPIRSPCEDIVRFVGIQVLGEHEFKGTERCVVVFDLPTGTEFDAFRGIRASEIGVNRRAC